MKSWTQFPWMILPMTKFSRKSIPSKTPRCQLSDFESVEDLIAEMNVADEPQETLLDENPIEPEPLLASDSDLLNQVSAELLSPAQTLSQEQGILSGPPLSKSTSGSKPKSSRRSRRSGAMSWESLAVPILTLVISCVVIPMAIALAWELGGRFNGLSAFTDNASNGGIKFGIVSSGLASLMFWALAVSMIIGSIVSIMELTNKIQIVWPSNVAAIVASVLLIVLVMFFAGRAVDSIRVASFANSLGGQLPGLERPGIARALFVVYLTFCQYAIYPMAVIALSFCRSLRLS